MAKTSIARGGDEILRPQSFYGSTPARPAALRTVDAAGKSNVGPNKALNILNTPSIAGKTKKAKDKLPGKPKPAAVIFAEEQVENQVLDQASNFPMFDAKKLRSETRKVVLTDSLQDWEDGKISEELVQEFTKKAEDEKLRYRKEVELWNKNHPDDPLVLDDNGIAVKQWKLKEAQAREAKQKEKKLNKKIAKAKKEKRSAPAKTPMMVAISKKAAARLAKTAKKSSQVQYESLSEGSGAQLSRRLKATETRTAGESEDSESDEDESSALPSADDDDDDNELSEDGSEVADDPQKENSESPARTVDPKKSKSQGPNQQSGAKRSTSKRDSDEEDDAAVVQDGKRARLTPKEGVVKTKARSRRQQRNGTHDAQDTQENAPAPKVTVPYKLPKKKGKGRNAEKPKDMSQVSKQNQRSKRQRQEEEDTTTDPQIRHIAGDAPRTGTKKSKQTPTPMAKAADAEGGKAAVKRPRGSKRRSQTTAVKSRPQTRRDSASSVGGSEGEYCGEFALH